MEHGPLFDQAFGTFLAVLFAQIPAGIAYFIAGRITVSNMMVRLSAVEKELEKMGNLLVGLTETQGRINVLDQRLLEQGRRLDDLAGNLGQFMLAKLKS